MVRVTRNRKILLIYSKQFLFFEWKLEASDLRVGYALRSPGFNLGDEENSRSFLEFYVSHEVFNYPMYLFLHHPQSLSNGYCVLTILDKNNSSIGSITKPTDNFKADEVDLFGNDLFQNRGLPTPTDCPIIVTCSIESFKNDYFSVLAVNDKKIMSEISTNLKNVLDQGLNTDIELITDGESIKAHKIILQARSPVFRRMFEHDSIEASKNTVVISDIGSVTVKRLVNFLYTGVMDECDFEDTIELYYAADKYEVLSLREDSKAEMLKRLDVNNACRLFTLANGHNDDGLKKNVVQFVSANFMQVVSTEFMSKMSKDDMLLLTRLCAAAGINC